MIGLFFPLSSSQHLDNFVCLIRSFTKSEAMELSVVLEILWSFGLYRFLGVIHQEESGKVGRTNNAKCIL